MRFSIYLFMIVFLRVVYVASTIIDMISSFLMKNLDFNVKAMYPLILTKRKC